MILTLSSGIRTHHHAGNPLYSIISKFGQIPGLIREYLKMFVKILSNTGIAKFSNRKKILILVLGFCLLAAARFLVFRFNFHLGYLYLMLICLSAFWFGIRGGIIAAVAASAIFFAEINLFRSLTDRETVLQTIYLRFLGYAWGGILTGVLSEFLRSMNRRDTSVHLSSFMNNRVLVFFNSFWVRIGFLAVSYAAIEVLRLLFPNLSFFLDYSGIILICIGGFCFGLKGGLICATVTFTFFMAESIIATPETLINRYFLQNLLFSFIFCYVIGIVIGIIADVEKAVRNRLSELAFHDDLTNCVSSVTSMQILEKEISRSARYNKQLTYIIMDIDDFKKINDNFGHNMGNIVLKLFAEAARENLRTEDTVGRFGGDEFIVILPETGPESSLQILDKINIAFKRKTLPLNINITFSAGISCYPKHGYTKEMIFSAADNALYDAKKKGKNLFQMERREYTRLKPVQSAKIHLLDKKRKRLIEGFRIDNISSKGMLILFPDKLEISDELFCTFNLPRPEDGQLELECKVVYKDLHEDQFRVGVYFPELPSEWIRKITEK